MPQIPTSGIIAIILRILVLFTCDNVMVIHIVIHFSKYSSKWPMRWSLKDLNQLYRLV